jgi:hypothetical protein
MSDQSTDCPMCEPMARCHCRTLVTIMAAVALAAAGLLWWGW